MNESADGPVTGAAVLAYLALIGLFFVHGETWASWKSDANLASWVQAAGSIAAILTGFWFMQYQHALDRCRDDEAKLNAEVDVINGAMLVLMREGKLAFNLQQAVLSPMKVHPYRHLALPPTHPIDMTELTVDWSRLAFLATKDEAMQEALMGAIHAHDTFSTAMRALEVRNRLHGELQSVLDAKGIRIGISTFKEAETAAGERLTYSLRQVTDDLFSAFDSCIEDVRKAGSSGAKAFRKNYPGRRISGFLIGEEAQAERARRQ